MKKKMMITKPVLKCASYTATSKSSRTSSPLGLVADERIAVASSNEDANTRRYSFLIPDTPAPRLLFSARSTPSSESMVTGVPPGTCTYAGRRGMRQAADPPRR